MSIWAWVAIVVFVGFLITSIVGTITLSMMVK